MRALVICLLSLGFITQASADDSWFARENRVAVVFNFNYATADLSAFDGYATTVNGEFKRQGFPPTGYEAPSSVLGAELAIRYYAPYYVYAQVGGSGVLASGEYKATPDKLEYWNVGVEVPIIIGGHYPVHDRIHLHAGLGPSIMAFSGSYWDSLGGLPDFEGDVSVGMQARLGAEFYATSSLAFGLEFMYRLAKSDMTLSKGTAVRINGEDITGYEVDFSGVGLTIGFRLVI